MCCAMGVGGRRPPCSAPPRMSRSMLLLPLLGTLALAVTEPERPRFSETFRVHTTEIDDTDDGAVVLQQVLVRDAKLKRSAMSAHGKLTSGYLEEVVRCDAEPNGWFASAGGPTMPPSSWNCDNRSFPIANCPITPFWTPLPQNATYVGEEIMDGVRCNLWTYWTGHEQFGFWAGIDPVVPVAAGKIHTSRAGDHLWHLVFRNYTVQQPPASAFAVAAGVKCPPAHDLARREPSQPSSLTSLIAAAEVRSRREPSAPAAATAAAQRPHALPDFAPSLALLPEWLRAGACLLYTSPSPRDS